MRPAEHQQAALCGHPGTEAARHDAVLREEQAAAAGRRGSGGGPRRRGEAAAVPATAAGATERWLT